MDLFGGSDNNTTGTSSSSSNTIENGSNIMSDSQRDESTQLNSTTAANLISGGGGNGAGTAGSLPAGVSRVELDPSIGVIIYSSSSDQGELDEIVNVTREYPYDYAAIMFGYIMPFVLVLTIITNTLVVAVLAQRHMRTPTNIVLFAMAIVDLMTLLSPSPWYFYIYTLGYHDKFLYPPGACYAHHLMTDVVPVYFHTSSTWLALLLASQRYIYVCHPTLARTWCTVPRVKKAIIIILVIAFLHQILRFFDNTFKPVYIQYDQDTYKLACKISISAWVKNIDIALYYTTYYTFRILFVFIIPCISLITLNYLLFRALRRAERNRSELMRTKLKLVGNNRCSVAGFEATTRGESSYIGQKDLENSNTNIQININTATNNTNQSDSVILNRISNPTNDSTDSNRDGGLYSAKNDNRDKRHNTRESSGVFVSRGSERKTINESVVGDELHELAHTTTTANSTAASKRMKSIIKGGQSSESNEKASEKNDNYELIGKGGTVREEIHRGGGHFKDISGSGCEEVDLHFAGFHKQNKKDVTDDGEDKGSEEKESEREKEEDDDKEDGDDDELAEGEEDEESTCAECALYAQQSSAFRECPRCSTDERHHQVSQCSSLFGPATNTTTNEDISSCLITQNASSSMFATHDETLDPIEVLSMRVAGENDENSSQRSNDFESLTRDCVHRRGAASKVNCDEDHKGDGCGGDDTGERGGGGGNSVLNEPSESMLTKSGSVDSRLVCGCLTTRGTALGRKRLLGGGGARERRKECRKRAGLAPCHSVDNGHPIDQRNRKSRKTCAHSKQCLASCSSSDPCIQCNNSSNTNTTNRYHAHSNHRDTEEALKGALSKGAPSRRNLPTSQSDYGADRSNSATLGFNQNGHEKTIDANNGGTRCGHASKQIQSANGGDTYACRDPATTATITTTTTTTTTTTLYSTHTNSMGSLPQMAAMQQHQHSGLVEQEQQSQQQQLKVKVKRLGAGQQARIKSPSFASSIGGRGSRATLLGGSTTNPLLVPGPNLAQTPATIRTMDSNRTTLMLIVVVTVFLMVEVPVAIVTILHVVLNSFEVFKDVHIESPLNYIKLFTNFFIMISYSVNFTIYCSMSKKFRETFRDLFLCGRRARRQRAQLLVYQNQHSQYNNNNNNYNYTQSQPTNVTENHSGQQQFQSAISGSNHYLHHHHHHAFVTEPTTRCDDSDVATNVPSTAKINEPKCAAFNQRATPIDSGNLHSDNQHRLQQQQQNVSNNYAPENGPSMAGAAVGRGVGTGMKRLAQFEIALNGGDRRPRECEL